mmetsp:Transcript_22742/g.52611  ORF Transcript_22742/g.52611 Transcript_22742/m.52611 type:complete len:179 (+) Transcript_22742:198-734(+)
MALSTERTDSGRLSREPGAIPFTKTVVHVEGAHTIRATVSFIFPGGTDSSKGGARPVTVVIAADPGTLAPKNRLRATPETTPESSLAIVVTVAITLAKSTRSGGTALTRERQLRYMAVIKSIGARTPTSRNRCKVVAEKAFQTECATAVVIAVTFAQSTRSKRCAFPDIGQRTTSTGW